VKTVRLALACAIAAFVAAPVADAVLAHPDFPARSVTKVRAGGPAPAPKLRNTRLVSHFDPGGGFHADVVEHGRFAYLGSWGAGPDPENPTSRRFCPSRGVRVIDIHDPSRPKLVATFADGESTPALDGSWTEKVIVKRIDTPSFEGTVAAVSIQACAQGGFVGFGLWDVRRPNDPKLLALYETPGTGGSHELWLQPRGDKAYVYTAIMLSELTTSPTFNPKTFNATTPGEPDFRIIDVSNPRNPVKVGEWGAWKELGIHPLSGFGFGGKGDNVVHSVVVFGTRAYLSYWDLGTVILDVSNPSRPRFLGRTQFPQNPADDEGNAHSAWIAKDGKVLIQTDEDFVPEGDQFVEPGWGHPRFYDISNPRRPRRISILMLPSTKQLPPPAPGDYTVHDPKVRGDTVYFSWYSEGVVVVDIKNVRRPRVVAQFVPPPVPDPMGFFPMIFNLPPETPFVEVWGVFLHRNVVLASDMSSGLWIFKVRR
jgi:hypothetical protein